MSEGDERAERAEALAGADEERAEALTEAASVVSDALVEADAKRAEALAEGSYPVSALGRLADSLDAATADAQAAREVSERTTEELASEKKWRGWALRIAIGSAVVIITAAVALALFVSATLNRQDSLLAKVTVSPAACAHQTAADRTLGCQNAAALAALQAATGSQAQAASARTIQTIIAQVVNQTDCRVRADLADALHAALPSTIINLPSTASCPAYRTGP
ncbi:MAG: hypothetical protein V4472_25550 [Pseudomonadota bacterium]